ncbi:M20 metallopeptidase family protein [Wansuia hejianensis]|uniref:Amidohydrolase n=1 Tax=Wansuia hejianensis TaxID=2763667 RepID=A0A926F179_9FIRM|nr:M20 family metallopeptidase [Wansuia hejianensis]MBC8590089.1 amidohydrolase [Wansuia hejianensis]
MDIYGEVKGLTKDLKVWRRTLHRIPELGLVLPKTSEYICKELDSMGIKYKRLLGGSGVVGIIEGTMEGKTLAIRADMDGLPIKEETGLEFSSLNECMHACGHDGHMAALLGTAKFLNNNRNKFRGNVKLIFQPGEEYPGGAKKMIEEGVLENPKVDRIIGAHMGQLSGEVKFGDIGVKYGPMMASMDRFYIKLIGKGCHGAYPHLGIDPIVMAGQLISLIQEIKSREIAATDPAVISICRINGGFNQNIIPEKVELEGTVRCLNKDTQLFIQDRIEKAIKSIVDFYGGDYEYEYEFKYPPVINDSKTTEDFERIIKESRLKDNIIRIKEPLMGGEDMSYYLQQVPGTFFYLSNIKAVNGQKYDHHNSKFDIDEDELWKVVYAFSIYAINYLNS